MSGGPEGQGRLLPAGSRRATTRQAEGCQGLLLGLWRAEAMPRQVTKPTGLREGGLTLAT